MVDPKWLADTTIFELNHSILENLVFLNSLIIFVEMMILKYNENLYL